jgi:surface antigen
MPVRGRWQKACHRRIYVGGRASLVAAVIGAFLVLTVVNTGAAATTMSSHRSAPVLELYTATATPGSRVAVDIAAASGRFCRLALAGPGSVRSESRIVKASKRHIQWAWRAPRQVRRGSWDAAVRCGPSVHGLTNEPGLRFVITVLSPHAGRSALLPALGVRVSLTNHIPRGRAGATGGKTEAGVGGGHNPFDYGQCTYHAYEERPDIYDTAVADGVPRGGYAPGGGYWWDAWRWLSNAQRVGFPTGTTPVAGALVVFPKHYGGSSVGHVAYVERVNGDGSYVVSERNWNYSPNITYRTVRAYPGVAFIYGGPAGNPGSQAPQPPASSQAPSVQFVTPAAGSTVRGIVTLTATVANSAGVEFDAYYASDPTNASTAGWHVIGADRSGSGTRSVSWDTTSVPDQGNASWGTVNVAAIALSSSGSPTSARDYHRVAVANSAPPSNPVAVTHYSCASTAGAFGHYVPVGKHWADSFVAQGSTITGGYLDLGANQDGSNHQADIGIYTGGPNTLSGELGHVTVSVSGYGGANFTFPQPVRVTPGQSLWLVAVGIGDFTAYDENNAGADGCFIGSLQGFQ